MNPVTVMKALADETRYSLIVLLLQHEYCVGALSRLLGITESAVSQHLKVLKQAGLVSGEKRGYFTHYLVDRKILEQVSMTIRLLAESPRMQTVCENAGKTHHSCRKREE